MRTMPRKLVGAACNYVVFRRAFSQRANGIVPELSVPVLIVGAGPVGLTLSILLAKLGIKCSVVEKKSEFLQHPQAHFINNRTMEIFRKIGSLSTDIERLQPPIDQWRKFIYCTSLTGLLLGEVDHLHPQDLARNHSPTWVAHFSQHRLLSLLQLQAEQLGIHIYKSQEFCLNNLGHINLGYECVSIEQGSENVKARVSRTDTNTKDLLTINCSFLIGADGASSKVRKLLNIQMEGEEALQNLVSIHFFSMDLANHLIRNRPGMLYFVFNTKAIGVFVAHDLRSGEFIVQVPFYPPQQTFEAFTIDACKTIICDLAGTTDIHIDIKAVKQWIMHAQVAESYISRNGRVILAGDAAHRFPPAGGFGMNTGIQDAHNLAWKIGAVLRGVASHNLLRTYESERKPVAKANTALSLENFKAAMSIPSILGLDPSSARFIHEQVNGGIGSLLPHQVQKNIMEGIFALGRMQVGPLVLNSYNPLGSIRLKKLKHMLGEGRSLQLQFPAEDLGFRYHSGALLINEEEMQSYTDEHYVPGRRNEYKPVCAPGARIPHSNIRLLKPDFTKSDESVLSTLDINKADSVEFLAFVGPNESGTLWADLILKSAAAFRIKTKVVIVWPFGFSEFQAGTLKVLSKRISTSRASIQCASQKWKYASTENILHVEESDEDWWDLCKVSPLGTILVRPDDHVAWVSSKESSEDSTNVVQKVFCTILKKSLL